MSLIKIRANKQKALRGHANPPARIALPFLLSAFFIFLHRALDPHSIATENSNAPTIKHQGERRKSKRNKPAQAHA